MALSGTMSNPTDWLQFYNLHNNTVSGQPLPLSSSAAGIYGQDQTAAVSHHESTVVTTTTTATASASASSAALNPSSSNNNSLSPEGRVTKPVRKRSRASRRTPTTLLNTDTANFRAMVQQFTGGPSTASFAPQPVAAGFGFGLGARQGFVNNPNASVMVPPPGYNSHLQLQQQQQNPYLLSLNNNNNSNSAHENHQGFVQRLMSSSSSAARPTTNMGVSFSGDEFASSQVQGQQQPMSLVAGSGRPNSNASNENRINSFLY